MHVRSENEKQSREEGNEMLKGVTFLIRNSWTAFLGRCIINKDFLGRNFQGDEGLEETFETEKQACTKAWKLASIMYF